MLVSGFKRECAVEEVRAKSATEHQLDKAGDTERFGKHHAITELLGEFQRSLSMGLCASSVRDAGHQPRELALGRRSQTEVIAKLVEGLIERCESLLPTIELVSLNDAE